MRWKLRPEYLNGSRRFVLQSRTPDGAIEELRIEVDESGYFELDKFPTGMCLSAFATSVT